MHLANMRNVLDQIKYQKGGWTLHMLRGVLGSDKFQAGIREYYRQFRNGHATSAAFEKVMEETSGTDLGWFFKQWLPRPGSPVVEGGWSYDPEKKLVEIDLAQKQKGEPYRLPMEIGVTTGESNVTTRIEHIELTQAQQHFEFAAAREPSNVTLDPNTWVLMNAKFSRAAGDSGDVVFTNGNIYNGE